MRALLKVNIVSNPLIDHTIEDFKLVHSRLSDCVRHHSKCGPEFSSFIPTRLLDTGDATLCESPRIVSLAANGSALQYVTLSYCWGNNMPQKTKSTKQNINERMESISIEALPQTFKDAIAVVRQLGLRYIWIDALCIIQDSPEDWEREAAAMGEVYGNSLFTIAALSATGVTKGFGQGESWAGKGKGFFYSRTDPEMTEKRPVYIYARPRVSKDLPADNVLGTRGWTLQERELSRRILTYSSSVINWECKVGCWSNEVPWGILINSKLEGTHSILNRLKVSWGEDWKSFVWKHVISDYSSRMLTKEEDRLAALSGIAIALADVMGHEYAAGIWKRNVLADLLWKTRSPSRGKQYEYPTRRPRAYIAPSWSWASVIGPVDWDPQASRYPSSATTATIISLQAEPAGLNLYGAVKNGVLKIMGQIKPALCRGGASMEYRVSGPTYTPDKEEGRQIVDPKSLKCVAFVAHDIDQEGKQPGTIYCARILSYRQSAGQPEEWIIADAVRRTAKKMKNGRLGVSQGLALIPTEKGNGEFRRIGLVNHLLDAWLEDTPESTISIV